MVPFSSRVKTALVLSVAAVSVHAPSALAQGNEESRSAGLASDIVVTARRMEERLQDVPISITVFTQDQIQARGITNTNDLATYTPSLGMSNVLGNLQATFSLRGFNQEISTSATVGVFFADVVSPRGASNQQQVGDGAGPGTFFDLANVQVLKGPQGTLFGRNTTGGAILIVPQKPTQNFEGFVEGSYGNYDMYQVQAVLNVPLSDTARIRVGLDRKKTDGYVKNLSPVGPDAYNDVDYWAARASMIVDLTPDLENYTIATYTHSKAAGEANNLYQTQVSTANPLAPLFTTFGWLAQRELELRPANAGYYVTESALSKARTELTEFRLINTTTWRASDSLTIKNIASYAEMKYDLQNPVLGVGLPLDQLNASGTALIPLISNPAVVGPLAGGVNAILAGLNLPANQQWTLAGVNTLFLAAAGRFSPANIRPTLSYPVGTLLGFTNSNPNSPGHTAHQWTFVEELQFQGQAADGKLTWQGGLYYEESGPLSKSGSASANVSTQPNPENAYQVQSPYYGFGSIGYNDVKKKITSKGIYGQASYDISDQLKATAGIRYTWDKQVGTGALRTYALPFNVDNLLQTYTLDPATGFICTVRAPNITVANNCDQTNGNSSKAPTWLLGLDFKPSPDLLLYAKYVRGYRTGGVNLQLPVELQEYGKEKVDNYEAGVKATFRGAIQGTFNITGFYNDFTNQQVPVGITPLDPRFSNQQGVFNAGSSRIYGAEVEASISPFDGLVASASYAYLNTKIKEVVVPAFNNGVYKIESQAACDADPSKCTGPKVGDPLTASPRHKFSGTVAYTLPLDESIGDITISGTYTYTGGRVTTYRTRDAARKLNGFSLLDPFELVDFNLSWKRVGGGPVDVIAFVNNALKEKYHTFHLDISQNFQMAQLGRPRMYGLRVKYRFGD